MSLYPSLEDMKVDQAIRVSSNTRLTLVCEFKVKKTCHFVNFFTLLPDCTVQHGSFCFHTVIPVLQLRILTGTMSSGPHG